MKVLMVVIALGLLLWGCEQKRADDEFAAQPNPGDANKPGAWMWDKERGNPLERSAY